MKRIVNHLRILMICLAVGVAILGASYSAAEEGREQNPKKIVKIGWIQHNGDWSADLPAASDFLASEIKARTGLDAIIDYVPLDSLSAVKKYDVLILAGHTWFSFSDTERSVLKKYIESKCGLLFIDDCDNAIDGPFEAAAKAEMQTIFGASFKEMPADHALFSSFYSLAGTPATEWNNEPLMEIKIKGRTAVIYSDNDYSCGWENYASPDTNENSFKLGTNVALYGAFWNKFVCEKCERKDAKKLLHVSVVEQNEVKAFINSVGAKDLFEVTQVSLVSFNAGVPARLGDYDVIVFGVNDAYEPGEYGVERTEELKKYVKKGGGIVWTHDSMELKFDLGPDVEIPAGVDDVGTDWVSGAQVQVVKDHEMLHYPFHVANPGDIFDVQDTHSTGGIVTTADLILSFYGSPAAANNFYLTAKEWKKGRVVVNQFGHSAWVDNLPSAREAHLFVNSLYWAAGSEQDCREHHDDDRNDRECKKTDHHKSDQDDHE